MKESPRLRNPNPCLLLLVGAVALALCAFPLRAVAFPSFLIFIALASKLPLWTPSELKRRHVIFFYAVVAFVKLDWVFESIWGFNPDGVLNFLFFSFSALSCLTLLNAVIHYALLKLSQHWVSRRLDLGPAWFPPVLLVQYWMLEGTLGMPFLNGYLFFPEIAAGFSQPGIRFWGLEAGNALVWQAALSGKEALVNFRLHGGAFLGSVLLFSLPSAGSSLTEAEQEEKEPRTVKAVPFFKSGLEKEEILALLDSAFSGSSKEQPTLAVFPESALKGNVFQGDKIKAFSSYVREKKMGIILGADEKKLSPQGISNYNSALFFSPEFLYRSYGKNHPVMFAERVPETFRGWGMDLMDENSVKYEQGEFRIVEIEGVRVAVAICFDALIPSWHRKAGETDAELLVVISREVRLGKAAKLKTDAWTRMKVAEGGIPAVKSVDGNVGFYYDGEKFIDLFSETMLEVPLNSKRRHSGLGASIPTSLIVWFGLLLLVLAPLAIKDDRSGKGS